MAGVIGHLKELVLDLFGPLDIPLVGQSEYYASLREASRAECERAELERAYRESVRRLRLYIALVDWRDGGY